MFTSREPRYKIMKVSPDLVLHKLITPWSASVTPYFGGVNASWKEDNNG